MTLNLPYGHVTLDGVGFTAIGRLELIEILRKRAEALGVEIRFNHPVASLDELDADLIVGADGLNSLLRRSFEDKFQPTVEYFENHFAWFGTERSFDTLTQTFIKTDKGALNAHHYRFAPNRSTFIVECDDKTFNSYGFDKLSEEESAAVCQKLFAGVLEDAPLITNKSHWRQFPKLWCKSWVAGKHVLLGDAVHTAHFSIGSGTRLAMEDAIALVHALSGARRPGRGARRLSGTASPGRQEDRRRGELLRNLVRGLRRQDGPGARRFRVRLSHPFRPYGYGPPAPDRAGLHGALRGRTRHGRRRANRSGGR